MPLPWMQRRPDHDHLPFGGVDHDRHPGDVGLGGNQVEKAHHGRAAVEHGLVHIDVDHLRPVFHLLARHRQRLLELAVEDHAGKGLGAGDIGALADIDEQGARIDRERLQAGKLHGGDGVFGHAAHLGKQNAGERSCDIQA